MHVLITDDHAGFCQTLDEILAADGHRVQAVHTIDQATAFLESEPVDLVILDVNIPDSREGIVLLKGIQKRLPGLPAQLPDVSCHRFSLPA